MGGYSVVLFDEVEKAHPDIFNVLLQVLDDGRLTDGQGRTVDFTNTLIVLTSNLGAESLLEWQLSRNVDLSSPASPPTKKMKNLVGDPSAPSSDDDDEDNDDPTAECSCSPKIPDSVRDAIMARIKGHFRPEFINRLDDIVIFSPLDPEDLKSILDLELSRVQSRFNEKDIVLHLRPQAASFVISKAYSPIYGARPLRRFLERRIITPLANLIVKSRLPNHSSVVIDLDPDSQRLTFDVAPLEAKDIVE